MISTLIAYQQTKQNLRQCLRAELLATIHATSPLIKKDKQDLIKVDEHGGIQYEEECAELRAQHVDIKALNNWS